MNLRLSLLWWPVAVLLAMLSPVSVSAQASLISDLGGEEGFGPNTQCMSPNDDGSVGPLDITAAFPGGLNFFVGDGDPFHDEIFVNTNGNITFSGAESGYTPEPFPVANRPMIAPFWADVDIRDIADATSDVQWPPNSSQPQDARCDQPRETGASAEEGCAQPETNGVWWYLEAGRIVITWDEVGFFQCRQNALNTFQLILSEPTGCAEAGDFDVEFRFNLCEWNTGMANSSGGTAAGLPQNGTACDDGETAQDDDCGIPAQSGFDAGDNINFVEIMGSRTADIHTILCTQSNVGETGVWRFQIRDGVVVCPDAGEECDTGMDGVCAAGITSCVMDTTECVPLVSPAPSDACDALDNDCDGEVDEGDGVDGPCPGGQICDRGVCVTRCGEFGCDVGLVCNETTDRCEDPECLGVDCPEGQRCLDGACQDACTGVVCPRGQECRAGRCLDPCDRLSCDTTCTVCDDGACVVSCELEECPGGQTCTESGLCVDDACAAMTCPTGTYCEAGSCIDACGDVVCPADQHCEVGECVDGAPVDPPPTADGGMVGGDGGPGGTGGGSGSSADGGGSGSGADGGAGAGSGMASGGGCSVGRAGTSPVPWFALTGMALWTLRRRRRR